MTDSVFTRKHLAEDVAYWRARAEAAEERIRQAANFYPDAPPEPPIGTDYLKDGLVQWTRREDGWHCAGVDCRNCPCEWSEVWERDLERNHTGWLRRLP